MSYVAAFGIVLAGGAHTQPIGNNAGSKPSTQESHPKPKPDAPPTIPVSVQNDIHSIASALNAANQKKPSATDEDRAKRYLQSQEDMAKWAGRMFSVGIGEILITLAGVILVWRTLFHTRRTATAAENTVTQTDIHAQQELRAYVFMDNNRMDWLHHPANPANITAYRLSLVWKNSGQTPAKRVRTWISTKTFPVGTTPESLNFSDLGEYSGVSGPMGPGELIHGRIELPIADVLAAWNRAQDLYYWAWIEYDDAFSGTKRHRTEICSLLNINSNPTTPTIENPIKYHSSFKTAFNAYDAECLHPTKT
ncbi:MAG TPA: hypothetical protein VNW15_12630 [Rhizomicrobium sp.]|nr:hypothetical protein [Rhizomicrobium sp.]